MKEFIKKNQNTIGIVLVIVVLFLVFRPKKKTSGFVGGKRGVNSPDKLANVANFANDEELFMLSKSSLGF